MKQKLLFISLISGLIGLSAQSSSPPEGKYCKAQEMNEVVYKLNPASWLEKSNFERFTRNFSATNKATQQQDFVIPVVFHVYGDVQSGKTVSYEKIVKALEMVNKDYQGLNDDFNTVEDYFKPRRSAMNITFKLALIDPNGACSSGVVFHPNQSGFGNGGGYDAAIQRDAWDNKKYMNIYIQNDLYDDGDLFNSGVAWYPNTSMSDRNLARVVYNGSYIHGNTDKEFASILTHEFGHFLNLIHTFDGGCNDPNGDYVDDTPKENGLHDLSCTPGTNCDGDKVNIENYMGYNGAKGCYKMFTEGQVDRMLAALQHPARISLWQESNLSATGVNLQNPTFLTSDRSTFIENMSNDGRFSASVEISVNGSSTFIPSIGTILQDGVHFTHDFPNGLTPKLTVSANKKVTLILEGSAGEHGVANNGQYTINFTSTALSNASNCSEISFILEYKNPYEIVYQNLVSKNIKVSSSVGWKFFSLFEADFGAWRIGNGELKVETYGGALVTNPNSFKIAKLAENTVINALSNFTKPVRSGSYPQLDLRLPDYTDWDGSTGFIGYEFPYNGGTCYGWMKVKVDQDGNGYSVLEYAYNTEPGGDVYAGRTPKTVAGLTKNILKEAAANDGSIIETTTLELLTNGGTFTKSNGLAIEGTDYTIDNVPAGLSAVVEIMNQTTMKVSFTGNAADHTKKTAQVQLSLLSSIVTGGASQLQSTDFTISLAFINPYQIVYVKNINEEVKAEEDENWIPIRFEGTGSDDYGLFVDMNNNNELKLETYQMPVIVNEGSKDISLLLENDLVNESRNFQYGGDWPDLHNLRSEDYTAWDGKTGYLGIEYEVEGLSHYGWMKVQVAVDGQSYKLLEYAYNTEPESGLYTGQTEKTGLSFTPGILNESTGNDGSILGSVVVKLASHSATFVKENGTLSRGTDYTVHNLPAGLSTQVDVISNKEVRISLVGKAQEHKKGHKNFEIEFLNPSIVGGIQELGQSKVGVQLDFMDPYGVRIVDKFNGRKMQVNPTNNWINFFFEGTNSYAYGLLVDNGDKGKLKLESYGAAVVSHPGTNNARIIGYDQVIDENQTFVVPGSYPNLALIRSDDYTVWDNQTGFIGLLYKVDGKTHYGWIEIAVSEDGKSFEMLRYAYNTEPNMPTPTPKKLGLDELKNSSVVVVYPNPFDKSIIVDMDELVGQKVEVSIANLAGQIVYKKNIHFVKERNEISTSILPKGVYVLHLKGETKQFYKKIIKK